LSLPSRPASRISVSLSLGTELDRLLGQPLRAAHGDLGLLAERAVGLSRHRQGRATDLKRPSHYCGLNPTLRQSAFASYIRPLATTRVTLRRTLMSFRGSPSIRMRSARLPGSIVPVSRSRRIARAETIVAD